MIGISREFSLGHPAILLEVDGGGIDVEQLFVVAASVGDTFDEIFLARKTELGVQVVM
jgi:hypothetical protein